jgi:hypothetical protein
MQCWICRRQARGFRCSDLRNPATEARHYPLDWVFCSMRCLHAFSAHLKHWISVSAPELELAMDELSQIEQLATRGCLRAFGQAAEAIGFDKPLGAYNEAEAMTVITAIVTCFSAAMQSAHEATRNLPVRGARGPVVNDPLPTRQSRVITQAPPDDFDDEIPF